MSERSVFQPAVSVSDRLTGGEMATVGVARETRRVVASAPDRVIILVRRAIECLESDRRAALRCLKDVATLLGAGGPESTESAPPLPSGFHAGGLARWQARRVLAYIEDNLGSKLATRDLAALVSFSKSHFSRAFRRSFGLPPMAYVYMRRVERAKVMMRSTGEQLSEIALTCGFADQPHLNRSFRRMLGTSPAMWRRTNTGVEDAEVG